MPFLTELLAAYADAPLSIEGGNAERLPISIVTADSRQVSPGALFVAVKGIKSHGNEFIDDAIARGAVAIIIDNETYTPHPLPVVVVRVDNVRLALAKIASVFYAPQPAHIAAVTGTDGKTSTVHFFRQLWEMSYQKAVSIGTLGVQGAPEAAFMPAINTTPDPVQLHQTLQLLANNHYQYVGLEASSHGLHQYRLDGVKLQAAAFTNLSRDHLDYHGTLEAYFHAKLRLFTELLAPDGTAVLNADDPKFRRIADACIARNIRVLSYGEQGQEFRIIKMSPTLDGLAVQAEIMGVQHHFMLYMAGGFQVMNALAALGLYIGCGGSAEDGIGHLPHLLGVPGRVEKVATHPAGANIYVDYAHTPAALGNVLRTLRPHTKGRLVVVFGCGGDRDQGKRPEMGRMAQECADVVILADDNPRTEDPALIRKQILAGVPNAQNVGDRAQAIAIAIKSLQADDVLLIAGKGHEKTQIIGTKTLPFDDAEVVRYAVKLCEERAS